MPATTLNATGVSAATMSIDVTTGTVTGRRAVFTNGSSHPVTVEFTVDTGVTITQINFGSNENNSSSHRISSPSSGENIANVVVPGNSFALIHYNHTGAGTTDSIAVNAGDAVARHRTSAANGDELGLALIS